MSRLKTFLSRLGGGIDLGQLAPRGGGKKGKARNDGLSRHIQKRRDDPGGKLFLSGVRAFEVWGFIEGRPEGVEVPTIRLSVLDPVKFTPQGEMGFLALR